jgi:hypothetical protein
MNRKDGAAPFCVLFGEKELERGRGPAFSTVVHEIAGRLTDQDQTLNSLYAMTSIRDQLLARLGRIGIEEVPELVQ